MTPEDLAALMATAKANGRTDMVLKIRRKTNANRVRVIPGVMGEVVQWGDGTWAFPTVCFVQVADVERALAKAAAS